MRFAPIPDAYAILTSGGVSRQTKLAHRDGFLFATYGAGYVKLTANGNTSVTKLRWEHIETGQPLQFDRLGRATFGGAA